MKNKKTDSMSITNVRSGNPETASDLINYYGTYEIQPTANTDNTYPAIAQGFNKKQGKTNRQSPKSKKQIW